MFVLSMMLFVVDAAWYHLEVLLVNVSSDDSVELAHVSPQVEGAAAWVFGTRQAASRRALDFEFGHGVVGQAAGLVVGDR